MAAAEAANYRSVPQLELQLARERDVVLSQRSCAAAVSSFPIRQSLALPQR